MLNDERQEMLLGDIPRSPSLSRVTGESVGTMEKEVGSVAMAREKARTLDETVAPADGQTKHKESE